MPEEIYTFDPGKSRQVLCGYIEGDTFYRKINPSKHYIKGLKCYAIQRDVQELLMKRKDIKYFELIMTNPSKRFRMSADSLKGLKDVPEKFCSKHGQQKAIWLSQMREVRENAEAPIKLQSFNKPELSKQFSLW